MLQLLLSAQDRYKGGGEKLKNIAFTRSDKVLAVDWGKCGVFTLVSNAEDTEYTQIKHVGGTQVRNFVPSIRH